MKPAVIAMFILPAVNLSVAHAETGHRRKYCRITTGGRKALSAQRRQWKVITGTLNGIWNDLGEHSRLADSTA